MENTKKDELKKKLEKVQSLRKRAMDNYDSRERNLVEQIRETELEELKSKLGNKYYGRIVHVVVSYDNGYDERHYIGLIKPNEVDNDRFAFYGNLTVVNMLGGKVTEAFKVKCEYDVWCVEHIDTHTLFKDGKWTGSCYRGSMDSKTVSIRLASRDKDVDFIRSAFDKIRDDKVLEMDATRDSVLDEIKMYCKK